MQIYKENFIQNTLNLFDFTLHFKYIYIYKFKCDKEYIYKSCTKEDNILTISYFTLKYLSIL
jgi:hypothetical protein